VPELPDVEVLARRLHRALAGQRVNRVAVRDRSVVRSPSPAVFVRRLRGRRIGSVGRRGKYLLVRLSGGLVLAGHLRMTGDFEIVPRRAPVRPHTRLMLGVGSREVRFVDQRRFGHVDLVDAGRLNAVPGLRALGVEPLGPEFSARGLAALIRGRRGGLKAFLLRQDRLAGIGNLYADEILFQARLHPARAVALLRPPELRRLHGAIRRTLRRGIAGLSRRGGAIGDLIAVRDRGGACPRCGGPLRTATIGGRTTYFCPRCQTR
jgi:formamidopyrimidine-DNA glycosylase